MGNSPIVNRINSLLAEKGIEKKEFYKNCGITSASYSLWNTGKTKPRMKNLENIANYLGVPVSYLLEGTEQKETAAIDVVDDDLKEYLDELRTRPEIRMLFSTTKTATKAQIEAIVKFIEGMQDNQ